MEIKEVIEENRRRNRRWRQRQMYDPVKGTGCCGRRRKVEADGVNGGECRLPVSMINDPEYERLRTHDDWVKLRCRHDFEYWAVTCVKICDKSTGEIIPFRLNAPQRRVLRELEEDRVARRPIRMIMLKARQWGGSTLIQMYMAWIQTCLRTNWNSLICAHVKDAAAAIRGMYTRMMGEYPQDWWQGDEAPGFKSFERSINTRVISGRGCRVTVGSSENHDAVRGSDYAMAHLSEVAFWRDSQQATPEGLIRAVCGAINRTELTLVVLESTANGVGSYFHREWLRAVEHKSDKKAVFVPWHEIEIYRLRKVDAQEVWDSMDDYERGLWEMGLTLEQIGWFQEKRREYQTLAMMQAEYPTTHVEAFTASESNVFALEKVEALREGCKLTPYQGELEGDASVGQESLKNVNFRQDKRGRLLVWRKPDKDAQSRRYVVSVDVGGRSSSSDWSVIVVVDTRGGNGSTPEVVAQWRGHCDHDVLAWMAARMAVWYGHALLVFESNSLEGDEKESGDPSMYILNEVRRHYPNLYYRPSEDGKGSKPGFHTNRSTKAMVINRLIAYVRDRSFIEHSHDALDELITYHVDSDGVYAAQAGCHDDMLMARAIALHVAATSGAVPRPPAPTTSTNRPFMRAFSW